LTDEQVAEAMSVMDAGLIREGYYAKLNARIPVAESEDPVDYDEYGWSEHVSRKYGVHGAGRGETLHQNLRQQNIVVDEGGDQR
jgi:hypothetical protein